MSKTIEQMTPNEIIQAVRARDRRIIRALLIDGVKVKKIWSQDEAAELTGVHPTTVGRIINGGK